LFRAALDAGHRKFIIGIGGSATNDGGAGFAQALGFRLLDERGDELERGGAALARLDRIDSSAADGRLGDVEVMVACDVNNPLCGPTGASAIFGPQKGATPEMVRQLDAALAKFAEVVARDLGKDVKERPGAGAAGGLGAGLIAFVHADLRAGVDIVLDAVRLDDKLAGADLVITGEGQIDRSTVFNKAPVGVARRAKKRGIPVIAVAGSLGEGYEQTHELGIDAAFSLVSGPMSLDDAIGSSRKLIERAAEEAMRAALVGWKLAGRPADTLTMLFSHNLWANLRLLERCVGLTDEQLNATGPGAFGSIRETLEHIVTSERSYFSRISTGKPYPRLEGAPPLTITEMIESARASGKGLVEWAPQVQAGDTVEVLWDGSPRTVPKTVILTQVINHATEHRGQVMSILTQLGIEPPDLQSWQYYGETAS
jgi:uncharacterized damage-inducible protein DinB